MSTGILHLTPQIGAAGLCVGYHTIRWGRVNTFRSNSDNQTWSLPEKAKAHLPLESGASYLDHRRQRKPSRLPIGYLAFEDCKKSPFQIQAYYDTVVLAANQAVTPLIAVK